MAKKESVKDKVKQLLLSSKDARLNMNNSQYIYYKYLEVFHNLSTRFNQSTLAPIDILLDTTKDDMIPLSSTVNRAKRDLLNKEGLFRTSLPSPTSKKANVIHVTKKQTGGHPPLYDAVK